MPQGKKAVYRRSSTAHRPKTVYKRRSTAHYPQAVQQCAVGAPLPMAPGRCGSRTIPTVHCPAHCGSRLQDSQPMAHWPQTVRAAMCRMSSTAPKQCSGVPPDVHCTLPPGSAVIYCKSSTAHCPKAGGQCTKGVRCSVNVGVPLPTANRRCGRQAPEFHCPLPQGSVTVGVPLPPTRRQCDRKSSVAHCPKAVQQCTAGVPLPTAPGSVTVGFPLLTAPPVRQCIAGVPPPTAPRQCDRRSSAAHC